MYKYHNDEKDKLLLNGLIDIQVFLLQFSVTFSPASVPL